MIPERFLDNKYRFIKVGTNKAPIELEWTTKNCYLHYDSEFVNFVRKNKRYGIVTGYGNLVVIDFDDRSVQEEVVPKLPETFMVKSAGKRLLHLYYHADKPESFKVLDLNKETLADVQGEGKQIIGANSEMPNGKKYEIVKDVPIADIKMADIKGLFSKWTKLEDRIRVRERKEKDDECAAIKQKFNVSDLLSDMGIDTGKNPTECPLHSSKGGRCFSYNDQVWHCFHCEQKGNIFHLYMLKHSVDFVEAKKKLAERVGIRLKETSTLDRIAIDNYIPNVKEFHKYQPFFYDRQQIFWFWNKEEFRYNIVDDIDLMRDIDKILGLEGQTVSRGMKLNYIEAFKRVGRGEIPKPAPKKWIQFKDKAYSLKSGNVYDITPDYFFTNPIPWEMGGSGKTPTMDKLFTEWVGKDNVQTLYEIIAYCCYTDYPIHLIFCLVGSGRNGKSRFQALMGHFIGQDNICSTELDLLTGNSSSRFESFKLYKKLICMMGETNFAVANKTSMIKKLSGQDYIGFEMKNKNPFDEHNYAKIVIASNSLPRSEDTSEGWYRRWMIIDFPNCFPEGKDILETLPEQEYNNLAKKVTQILSKLLESGKFTKQGTIEEREHKYLMSSNPLPIFIKICCDKKEEDYVSFAELYTAFVQFLKHYKKRRINRKEFSLLLSEEGFWSEKKSKVVGENEYKNTSWVDGLNLKSDLEKIFGRIGQESNESLLALRERGGSIEIYDKSPNPPNVVIEEFIEDVKKQKPIKSKTEGKDGKTRRID